LRGNFVHVRPIGQTTLNRPTAKVQCKTFSSILLYIATSFPNLGQSVFDTVFLRDPILGKRFHIFLFFQIKIGAALFLIVNSLVNG